MLKSFCIKTNNCRIIDKLLSQFENVKLDNIYITKKQFAIYQNIIVHYSGDNIEVFYEKIAEFLSKIILDFYERNLFYKIIRENYFYFFDMELKEILKICIDSSKDFEISERYLLIYNECIKYIKENKSMILDGFVNFRLYDYVKTLDEIVDYSINKYLVQREYLEFIKLLKEYISYSEPTRSIIHLIYSENNNILLDEDNIIIPIEENISQAKYLSDISFSKNDYCLNTLLNILPHKIIIHLLCPEDEFIDTLKAIFCNKVQICNSCELCANSVYKIKNPLI